MSDQLPPCPQCGSEYTYEQGGLLVCPMDGYEWSPEVEVEVAADSQVAIRDSVGNPLKDGDTVTIAKDLKVKGAGSGTIKAGTKVKGILLIEDGVGDHDFNASVPGFGRMQLESSVVKKAS
ncbi:zinc ribbon domain-containing protein YjdM [Nesterenkonia rhizosphaerae]|uniref:Zinc ribbon domain-containing protein YjdM n=1 Tax=Nesterenkonia rhizosphaerae TaxID=1348272 RepID=A0ABP9FX92_9MICC